MIRRRQAILAEWRQVAHDIDFVCVTGSNIMNVQYIARNSTNDFTFIISQYYFVCCDKKFFVFKRFSDRTRGRIVFLFKHVYPVSAIGFFDLSTSEEPF